MIQKTVLVLIAFVLAYGLYVFPFAALWALCHGTAIFDPQSLLLGVPAFVCLWLYLRTGTTNRPLKAFVYYGMGIGFIALWVVGLALVAQALAGFESGAVAAVASTAIFVLSAVSLINARTITRRQLVVNSAKISQPVRFAFISDVHIGSHAPQHLAKICDHLITMDVDAVLIGGDLFDSSDFTLDDLKTLKRIKQDIFFITGNHEGYVKGHQLMLDQFDGLGITVLDNSAQDFAGINIIGIADSQPVADKVAAIDSLRQPDTFNLALVHQPSSWSPARDMVDLMLCGHTHNGQIFPFNFLVRLQFAQTYGRYGVPGAQLYVSSGAGCWGPGMRLGSRNEIIHLEILPS